MLYIEKRTYNPLVIIFFMMISAEAEQWNNTDNHVKLGKNGAGGSAYFNDGVTDYTKAGIIIGSVFGFLFLFAGIVLIRIRKSGIPIWFPCHKYNKLRQAYNVVDCEAFTIEEYNMQRDHLINLINNSVYQNTFYLEKGKEKVYKKIQVQMANQQPFITQLKINGKDQNEIWKAVGFILSRNKQIFLWMYEQCPNKGSLGKDANKNHLVYESMKIDHDGVKGKWFYCGFQQIDQCNGFWHLLDKKKQNSVKSQSITNVKAHLIKDTSASRFTNADHF